MICGNCRSTVTDNSRFCQFCGLEIDQSGLRLEKLHEIGAGRMVLAAAIFTALQGLLGIFYATWMMSLTELALAASLFMIWRGCQNGHSPVLGLKLAMYSILITAFGYFITMSKSSGSLMPMGQDFNNESFEIFAKVMGVIFLIFIIGLALTMWILYFLFYRSLYLVATQKAQRIQFAGFVSVMYLITAGTGLTSLLMITSKDLGAVVNGGWSAPYLINLQPMWMYINIQMTQGFHFILQILYYICSGISALFIGLIITKIKKVWR